MVKRYRAQIDTAVKAAEQKTAAHIAVVVVAAAEAYRDLLLPVGLALGTGAALVCGLAGGLAWPWLFVVQLCVALGFITCPASARILPRKILKHRAAKRMHLEYAHMKHHLPPGESAALLFVAKAERYVHLTVTRDLRDKLDEQHVQHIVDRLTAQIPAQGIGAACVATIGELAVMLEKANPRK